MNRTYGWCSILLWAALAAAPAVAQKKVAPTNAEVTHKNLAAGKPMTLNGIRETVLPNGLTVLTKEVHVAPVVYFSVYYRVGSVNEEVGQTGMSHLMEHMMFKGTRTRGPGVISASLQENGADFNASTSFDRTEYHETLAADRLELAMQIESDRMVNSVYDEAQHQKEMTVVRSEYEGGENNPGQALGKAVRLTAYQVHPYRWQPIGFRADIENFTRDEMYAYYKNYYTPNNATVVLVGDFNTARALALVRKYFGSLKGHPILQHFMTPEPPQEGERRVVVHRPGSAPQMQIDYHIPGFGSLDQYALDVLTTVLSGGRTSRFFQDLEQTGLAASANAYYYGLRDPDLLTLSAVAQPGHTNPELEKALLAEVDKLQSAPISAEELSRTLRQAEAEYIFGKESVEAQGAELGENAMRGDWRYGETYLEHLRKVTPADVQRVARKYLVQRNSTVGYFEPILVPGAPRGPAIPSDTGATTPPVARLKPLAPPSTSPLSPISDQSSVTSYQLSVVSHQSSVTSGPVDRAQPGGASRSGLPTPFSCALSPAARQPAATSATGAGSLASARPRATRVVLDNGLTVIIQENHANPTVSLSGAILSAGGVLDPPDKRGLARFTAAQLSRGTQSRSLLDIARTIEGMGASLNVSAGEEYAALGGRALSRDFDTLLDVLADELRHPAFPEAEMQRARSQTLARIQIQRQNTGALGEIAFTNTLFPRNHPYSTPNLEEQASVVSGLTREDLTSFHASHYAPNRTILVIVGDVKPGAALAAVKKYFGDWQKVENLPPVAIPNTPLPAGPMKPIVVQVPGKAQVDVLYGYPGQLDRRNPDFYRVTVLDTILGGGLSSRLGVGVRDRLGLVYTIQSGHLARLGAGPFEVYFGSNPSNVDAAVAETQRQIALLREKGATPEEVARVISYITGSYAVTLSTNGAVAQQLLQSQVYDLGLDYIQKRNTYYKSITLQQVNAAARKYLHPDIGALVISGAYSGKYSHH